MPNQLIVILIKVYVSRYTFTIKNKFDTENFIKTKIINFNWNIQTRAVNYNFQFYVKMNPQLDWEPITATLTPTSM